MAGIGNHIVRGQNLEWLEWLKRVGVEEEAVGGGGAVRPGVRISSAVWELLNCDLVLRSINGTGMFCMLLFATLLLQFGLINAEGRQGPKFRDPIPYVSHTAKEDVEFLLPERARMMESNREEALRSIPPPLLPPTHSFADTAQGPGYRPSEKGGRRHRRRPQVRQKVPVAVRQSPNRSLPRFTGRHTYVPGQHAVCIRDSTPWRGEDVAPEGEDAYRTSAGQTGHPVYSGPACDRGKGAEV